MQFVGYTKAKEASGGVPGHSLQRRQARAKLQSCLQSRLHKQGNQVTLWLRRLLTALRQLCALRFIFSLANLSHHSGAGSC